MIARAIHRLSSRASNTFVRLNCAAIPSGLLESELFGYEKGAFTGALTQKRGRFELADEGTLFLDEIGDISIDLQPKLLRAIQEREFERLGREDIPLLVHYFLSRSCRRMHKSITSIPRDTRDALMRWDWPGNIRERETSLSTQSS